MRWIDRWPVKLAVGLWIWFVLLAHYWRQAQRLTTLFTGGP